MPVESLGHGRYRWGKSGHVYAGPGARARAEAQGRAVRARGWRGDADVRRAARALRASARAEARYVRDLLRIIRTVHDGAMAVAMGRRSAKADDERPEGSGLGDAFLRRMFVYVKKAVGQAHDRMGAEVDRQNARGSELLGIPASAPGIAAILAQARDDNIRLVENAGRDYAADVRAVLGDPKNAGLRPEEIKSKLVARGKVSESRAMLIARDQTLKLNAALSQRRQTAAGVARYRWSTSHDERVRPAHAELDGETFDWDDPPDTGDGLNHPGEDYQCRCIAVPLVDEIEEPTGKAPAPPAAGEEGEGGEGELPAPGSPAGPPEPPEPPPPPPEAPEPSEPTKRPGVLDPAVHLHSVSVSPASGANAQDVLSAVKSVAVAAIMGASPPALRLVAKHELPPRTEGTWQRAALVGASGGIVLATDVAPPSDQATVEQMGWGYNWRVADTRASTADKVRSSFLHELGHHLHLGSSGALGVDQQVSELVERAYEKLWAKDPGAALSERAEVLLRKRRSPAISAYAAQNRDEYFAETFDAFIEEPEALKRQDPAGYEMVEQVLDLLSKAAAR